MSLPPAQLRERQHCHIIWPSIRCAFQSGKSLVCILTLQVVDMAVDSRCMTPLSITCQLNTGLKLRSIYISHSHIRGMKRFQFCRSNSSPAVPVFDAWALLKKTAVSARERAAAAGAKRPRLPARAPGAGRCAASTQIPLTTLYIFVIPSYPAPCA